MKNLIVRTITGIVFITLVVSSLFLPPVFFYVLFLTFSLVGTYEFLAMAQRAGNAPQMILPILLTATIFSAFQTLAHTAVLAVVLIMLSIFIVLAMMITELYRKKETPVINVSLSLFPAFWIAFPFGILGLWLSFFDAKNVVLALFIIIWACDTLAYCAGSLFGKRRLFERISPKKSWEGFIISLILTSLGAISFAYIPLFQNDLFHSPGHWFCFALLIIVASTFGDLTESLFKRNFNVKDSGSFFPGHGGVLDRFDSLLFAAPVAFVFWLIFYLTNIY